MFQAESSCESGSIDKEPWNGIIHNILESRRGYISTGDHSGSLLSYKTGILVTRKELLLLQATLALASLASQSHLLRTTLPAAKMAECKIRKTLDEGLASVEALDPPHTWVIRVVDDLLVQLEERFDVVTCKRNGNQQQVCLSPLHVILNRISRLGSQPRRRTNLRLPAQAIGVGGI